MQGVVQADHHAYMLHFRCILTSRVCTSAFVYIPMSQGVSASAADCTPVRIIGDLAKSRWLISEGVFFAAVPEMDRLTKLSTAGHVTRHRASALSNRERRALLRQQGPVAGNPSARPARPGRPRAEKALRSSRVRPAPRSQIAGAERAGQAPGAGEQRPQLQSSAAVEDHNPSAKALTSSRIKPASKGPEGERVPGGKSSRLRQPLGTGVSVSAHRKACRPQAQEGQRLKLRQRSGTAGPPRLQSVLVRATRHAAGTSNLNPRTRRTARQVVMALPETREEAIRMRIGQCCTMTNARRDIGIMKVPHEVSLGAGCSRALSARVASKRKQEAAPNVPVGTSQARPVPESLDSTLVLQPASGSQLQAPNRETTVLDIAPAKDAPPARESTDMLVVLPAADGPAPGNEFARPQRQQAAVTEPCSEAAAVPPLALAQPDARPAEHASSAPCSAASKAPRKQTACRTVARRTEPCTEEAALLEVPLPVSGGSAAPCDEAVTCAPGRLKRVPGGDPLQVRLLSLFTYRMWRSAKPSLLNTWDTVWRMALVSFYGALLERRIWQQVSAHSQLGSVPRVLLSQPGDPLQHAQGRDHQHICCIIS